MAGSAGLPGGLQPRRPRILLAAVLVLVVAAGAWLLGGSAVLAPGPSPTGASAWGPLAVVRTEADPAAIATGTIRFGGRCVTLVDEGGTPFLLVWPAARVTWLADEEAIGFTNRDGTEAIVWDGARVVLAGGAGTRDPGSSTVGGVLAGAEWLAAPDPSCPEEEYWLVSDVEGVG